MDACDLSVRVSRPSNVAAAGALHGAIAALPTPPTYVHDAQPPAALGLYMPDTSGSVLEDHASSPGYAAGASSSMGDLSYTADVKFGIEELCPVCGDKVSGYHYGLQTCESCKGFFKRTVQNKKVYSCVDNRTCHIDKSQRKRCPYCRFQKCLSVGMKLEAVRADRMRGGRNKFGPMYKRDRALKQQAVRQHQHLFAHCSMQMSAAAGIDGSPLGSTADVKPNISMFMQGPSPGNASSHNGASAHNGNANSEMMHESQHPAAYPNAPYPSPPLLSPATPQSGSMSATPNNPPTSTATMLHALPPLVKELQANEASPEEMQGKVCSLSTSELNLFHSSPSALQHQPEAAKDLLRLFCKICDRSLFLLVEWARGAHFFRDLKVEDQMKLLQAAWSELLVLDLIFRQMSHDKTDDLLLVTGHLINAELLSLIGMGDCKDRLLDLIRKFRELRVDRNDYICLKFLILLNSDLEGLLDRHQVESDQEKVNTTLMDYCTSFYPFLMDKFGQLLMRLPELRLLSMRCEDFLYFIHLNGDIPDQTLLTEMLHSKRK